MTTYVFRLYPSKPQERLLEQTRETCRHFYNDLLAERKHTFEETGRSVGKFEQLRHVKERKAENAYAAGVHSRILQQVVIDLDRAFAGFFRRVKAGETPGYPRFKGSHRFDSIGLREYGNGFKIDGRRLKVSGIGRIAVRWHREIKGTVKTLRLVKRADGWYACFACETKPCPLPPTGKAIGIDVGVASLITTSDGETVAHPGWHRGAQKKLRVVHRRISRRKRGGSNRRKAVVALKRQHQTITNQRKDFLNKLALDLIRRNDVLVLEDLRISNMVQNRHLSKSILDAGWGYLIRHLAHKAAEAGRVVHLVAPAYTSKTCSACGVVFDHLTLSVRHVSCVCGLSLDRDHNAAINILNRAGHARWAPSSPLGGLAQEPAGL